MEKAEPHIEGIADLFKVLGKPDALEILFLTKDGITNSTHTIEDMDISQKRYYARLKELIDMGLVRKKEGVYGQTVLGRVVYERFLPAMGKAVDAREELELIVYLEGTEIDNGAKKRILDELEIPSFTESSKVKLLRDYEALAIEVIDIYDSAEESVLLASNYFDVRIMEACFRAVDRGVTNRILMGKRSLSSKLQNLKMMLSLTFAKTIINFTSNKVKLTEFVRFIDLPYSFCVVDGQHSIIEFSNTLNGRFIVALSFDDRAVGEKLIKFYETLWNAGDFHTAIKVVNSIETKLNGEAPQQDSDL